MKFLARNFNKISSILMSIIIIALCLQLHKQNQKIERIKLELMKSAMLVDNLIEVNRELRNELEMK